MGGCDSGGVKIITLSSDDVASGLAAAAAAASAAAACVRVLAEAQQG